MPVNESIMPVNESIEYSKVWLLNFYNHAMKMPNYTSKRNGNSFSGKHSNRKVAGKSKHNIQVCTVANRQ